MVVKDDVTKADVSPYEIIEFPGGIFLVAMGNKNNNDDLNETINCMMSWINNNDVFEYGDFPKSGMCNIPNPGLEVVFYLEELYMEYLMLILVSLLWSSVGVLVKTASVMVSSNIISLCRFLFGVVFLLIFILTSGKKLQVKPCSIWVLVGALGKSMNYIFENIGITMGVSYGNVVVFSLQAVLAYIASIFNFKEKATLKKCMALIFCVLGVVIVSMRNMMLGDFLANGTVPLILFAIGAFGSAIHLISQKMLVDKVDVYNVNLSTFLIASLITAMPIPFTPTYIEAFSLKAFLALVGLGFVTGLSFVFYSKAIKKVSFFTANIITNLSIIFSLLWAWTFYRDPITPRTIWGALMMLSGIVLINIQKGGKPNEKD